MSAASFFGWWLKRPEISILGGLVIAICVFQLFSAPTNPPGFHRDEASISYNAFTLSQDLRDQDGARAPLYFVSFDDYKSPPMRCACSRSRFS
jgi:hypothetical protein